MRGQTEPGTAWGQTRGQTGVSLHRPCRDAAGFRLSSIAAAAAEVTASMQRRNLKAESKR